jgi:hypothetical protein
METSAKLLGRLGSQPLLLNHIGSPPISHDLMGQHRKADYWLADFERRHEQRLQSEAKVESNFIDVRNPHGTWEEILQVMQTAV